LYNQEVPEREDEEDEDEEEMNYATLQRLKKADERTKAMTKEEYVTWSEYRQASFTFRKGKRFKEWAGFGVVTDSKPNDDIVDILGFLTFEIVQTLTEEALKIKEQEDLGKEKTGGEQRGKKRKLQGLFDPPSEGRTPVETRHIQEAFRRLQQRPNKQRAMCNFTRGLNRTPLKLVSLAIQNDFGIWLMSFHSSDIDASKSVGVWKVICGVWKALLYERMSRYQGVLCHLRMGISLCCTKELKNKYHLPREAFSRAVYSCISRLQLYLRVIVQKSLPKSLTATCWI
jgi:hypothetical protein